MILALLAKKYTAGVSGPSADPSSVTSTYYGGSLIRVNWANGDASASTEYGIGTHSVEPGNAELSRPPGLAYAETGIDGTLSVAVTASYIWVRHVKNSQYSDWVRSSNGYTEDIG